MYFYNIINYSTPEAIKKLKYDILKYLHKIIPGSIGDHFSIIKFRTPPSWTIIKLKEIISFINPVETFVIAGGEWKSLYFIQIE